MVVRKLLAFLLGLFAVVAFAEAAMRVVAKVRVNSHPNQVSKKRDFGPPFRIVVLGESTSEAWWTPQNDVSWSAKLRRRLQKYFQAKGIERTVEIINLARSGGTSTLLVDHFEEVLQTTTPDILITMMGINDTVALELNRGYLYSNSFVARFLYWGYVSFRCPNCYKFTNEFVDDSPVAVVSRPILNLTEELTRKGFSSVKDLEQADAVFRSLKLKEEAKQSQRSTPAFSAAGSTSSHAPRATAAEMDIVWASWLYGQSEAPELNRRDVDQEKQRQVRTAVLKLADKYLVGARATVVTRKGSIKQHCFLLDRLRERPETCLALVKDGLNAGVKLTPDFLGLALSVGAENDPAFKTTLDEMGYSIPRNRHGINATIASYRRLMDLQKSFGFRWLAMQYPRGSALGLARFFDPSTTVISPSAPDGLRGFADVFNYSRYSGGSPPSLPQGVDLVSNENFNTVVVPENEAEYFRDMFARGSGSDFGHTTEKGHALIADNVLKVIVERFDFEALK
ncbi:MAG: hypothetical protein J0L82_06075 [Deltaproteobacteria bacterium]|nr:hypothetical protein [Deltaproteobacteria bacterium]